MLSVPFIPQANLEMGSIGLLFVDYEIEVQRS